MDRKKLLKWCALFFCAMVLFTFLSRVADSVSVAKVSVAAPQNQVIVHAVNGTGKIKGTKETAVFLPEGQKIAQVHVNAGEAVKKGQVLLTLLESSLKESAVKKQDEIQEISLKIGDIQSQKDVAQQKKQYEASRAQEDLDTAVSNGDINISNAQNELNIANQRLAEYRAEKAAREKKKNQEQNNGEADFSDGNVQNDLTDGNNVMEPEDNSQEQALMDDVRAKTEALNQVIMSRNQEVKAAGRARQDASIPEARDSTGETLETQLIRLNEELEEINSLIEKNGQVEAPSDGVIKNLSVQSGGQTAQDAAAVLYELTGGLIMEGSITKEDLEYVSAGSVATLTGTSGTEVENVQVQSVQEDSANPGTFILTARVPESSLTVGESVDFTVEKKNGPYSLCVPLSALYGTEGQEYVFVQETRDSVLGEVQVVRKAFVTVKEKDESWAALQEGSLSTSQKVITGTDREIDDGSRIRLQES